MWAHAVFKSVRSGDEIQPHQGARIQPCQSAMPKFEPAACKQEKRVEDKKCMNFSGGSG